MSALERYTPPQSLGEIERLAGHFASSGLFGNSPKTQGEIIVKMLAGAENGFPPFASVQGIHVIQGKPEMGADLLARSVKQSGRYDYRVRELTDESCILEFFEHGESIGVSSFSIGDAKRAGISNAMYGKYPRNMLFARAMSNGVSWYCPDATSTRFYVDGEISGGREAPTAAVPSMDLLRTNGSSVIGEVTVEPDGDAGRAASGSAGTETVRAGASDGDAESWTSSDPAARPAPAEGEPERIVADQLAAIGKDGRSRIKTYLRDNDLVLDGDQRQADTWIASILKTWGEGDPPYYCDLADVLSVIDEHQAAKAPSSTPLTRQEDADTRAGKEAEGLFENHAPKAQGALTPRMYDANQAGS